MDNRTRIDNYRKQGKTKLTPKQQKRCRLYKNRTKGYATP